MPQIKKKVLYNPLEYFKRSKTFDFEEMDYNTNIKDEIKRVLDRNLETRENTIVSLNNIDSDKSINNDKMGSNSIDLSTKTLICIPHSNKSTQKLGKIGKFGKNDAFLKFFKDFKIEIPGNFIKTRLPVSRISVGINTSKEPSPINNGNIFHLKNFQPNFLENMLGINNSLMMTNHNNNIIKNNTNIVNLPMNPMNNTIFMYSSYPNDNYYLNPMINNNNNNQINGFGGGIGQNSMYSANNDKNFMMMGGLVNKFFIFIKIIIIFH